MSSLKTCATPSRPPARAHTHTHARTQLSSFLFSQGWTRVCSYRAWLRGAPRLLSTGATLHYLQKGQTHSLRAHRRTHQTDKSPEGVSASVHYRLSSVEQASLCDEALKSFLSAITFIWILIFKVYSSSWLWLKQWHINSLSHTHRHTHTPLLWGLVFQERHSCRVFSQLWSFSLPSSVRHLLLTASEQMSDWPVSPPQHHTTHPPIFGSLKARAPVF